VIDHDRIPIPRHLRSERATERCGIVLGRNIWKAAEEAPRPRAPVPCRISLGDEEAPLDPIGGRAPSAISRPSGRQNRDPYAGATEIGQKMKTVRQVAGIGPHRIEPGEPKTPQPSFVDLPWNGYGFVYHHQAQENSLQKGIPMVAPFIGI
jgi:hypothetical protein